MLARCYFSEIHIFVDQHCFWTDFLDDFGRFCGSFREPKWNQNGFKNRSKKMLIFGSLLEGLWDATGGPPRSKLRGDGSTERGRGEVNLSPRGFGDVGMWEMWDRGPLNHGRPEGWWDYQSRKASQRLNSISRKPSAFGSSWCSAFPSPDRRGGSPRGRVLR